MKVKNLNFRDLLEDHRPFLTMPNHMLLGYINYVHSKPQLSAGLSQLHEDVERMREALLNELTHELANRN